MAWGSYLQHAQNGGWEELNNMGLELSRRIHCAVHYPAFDKPFFECRCGVAFPSYVVHGAINMHDWSAVIEKHKQPDFTMSMY